MTSATSSSLRPRTQGIVIRRHYAENLPAIPLDEDPFKQSSLNLFLNAKLAMPDGGELLVTTRRDGPFVALDLTDTGCGIAPENQSHIFDPFFSTRPGGSGLGLPTVRKIVEAHGGQIQVKSVPGKGSRFTILLPVDQMPDESDQWSAVSSQ